ncbi:heme exporter protein CcmB [Salinicola avicenniae]|uniref:heme exporter protein CcmB n=1 Tax=Salinicola avicenniae TaxID=2916836 RepID=UPI002072ED99|nr:MULTISPECIES: heme exporter protein CcmB [unclassified Salinicola]
MPVATPTRLGWAHVCLAQLRRELALARRRGGDWLNPLLFLALVVVLFPLGISPQPARLADVAPGLLWVAALLAMLLSLDALFRTDHADGTLEQMLLAPQPLPLLCLTKVVVHWLLTGVPLALCAPWLGVLLSLPAGAAPVLIGSLLLGSATLSLIGAIGAALTVGLPRGGILLSLLILPLYIPVLIFGAGAVQTALAGGSAAPAMALLGAMLALAVAGAPFAIAGALRISVNG